MISSVICEWCNDRAYFGAPCEDGTLALYWSSENRCPGVSLSDKWSVTIDFPSGRAVATDVFDRFFPVRDIPTDYNSIIGRMRYSQDLARQQNILSVFTTRDPSIAGSNGDYRISYIDRFDQPIPEDYIGQPLGGVWAVSVMDGERFDLLTAGEDVDESSLVRFEVMPGLYRVDCRTEYDNGDESPVAVLRHIGPAVSPDEGSRQRRYDTAFQRFRQDGHFRDDLECDELAYAASVGDWHTVQKAVTARHASLPIDQLRALMELAE